MDELISKLTIFLRNVVLGTLLGSLAVITTYLAVWAFGAWWVIGSIATFFGIWTILSIFYTITKAINTFEDLLGRFIVSNQEYYETQQKIIKQQNEISQKLNESINETTIIRRYINNLDSSTKNASDVIKQLRETLKIFKNNTDELKVSKDIAKNLSNVSSNIKILDQVIKKVLNRRNNNGN